MKRRFGILWVVAVVIACAPMAAIAIRPTQQVAPIEPPREIGDDDQPLRADDGEPGIDAAVCDTSVRAARDAELEKRLPVPGHPGWIDWVLRIFARNITRP